MSKRQRKVAKKVGRQIRAQMLAGAQPAALTSGSLTKAQQQAKHDALTLYTYAHKAGATGFLYHELGWDSDRYWDALHELREQLGDTTENVVNYPEGYGELHRYWLTGDPEKAAWWIWWQGRVEEGVARTRANVISSFVNATATNPAGPHYGKLRDQQRGQAKVLKALR
jgi:hypothetical protein